MTIHYRRYEWKAANDPVLGSAADESCAPSQVGGDCIVRSPLAVPARSFRFANVASTQSAGRSVAYIDVAAVAPASARLGWLH